MITCTNNTNQGVTFASGNLDGSYDSLNCHDNIDNGLRVIQLGGFPNPQRLVISNSVFKDNGDFGIALDDGNDYLIIGCAFDGNTNGTVRVDAGVTGIVTFMDCRGIDLQQLQIPDDTVDSGFRIFNSDGEMQFVNGSATVGAFSPTINNVIGGVASISAKIITKVPVASDTGTVPAFNIQSQQDDGTDLAVRPIFGIRNRATELFTFGFDGNVVHTIVDDVVDIGYTISNSDGKIALLNGTGVANSFSGTLQLTAAGAAGVTNKIISKIPVASDTGSIAAFVIQSQQDDNTDLVTRPILTVQNRATVLYTFGLSNLTFGDAVDIAFNTTTGTKIGTSTSQKLAFYNATPIVQQTGVAVTAAGIHAALVSLGLITA